MKLKCDKCKKWTERKYLYNTTDSWIRPHYVCRKCMFAQGTDHTKPIITKDDEYPKQCGICKQWFDDHQTYLDHHFEGRRCY